jgi:hypothetical protein
MGAVKDFLSLTPPEYLYHYTSQRGLVGIVQDKAIWASKIQYLNDCQEFKLALSIAKRQLEARRSSESGRELTDKLDSMLYELDRIESINVCVASFSEEADLLSQWRGYAGDSGGFSIGFDSQKLATAQPYRFRLLKCCYSDDEHERLVDDLLEATISFAMVKQKDIQSVPSNDLAFLHPLLGFENNMFTIAAVIKHSSFSEEREWRLVSKPVIASDLQFRPRHSMLVPYCSCPISVSKSELGIQEVLVGPCLNREQAVDAVTMLLYSAGCKPPLSVKVRTSSIPFRNW